MCGTRINNNFIICAKKHHNNNVEENCWNFPIMRVNKYGYRETAYFRPKSEKMVQEFEEILKDLRENFVEDTPENFYGVGKPNPENLIDKAGKLVAPENSPRKYFDFINQVRDTRRKFDRELDIKFSNCVYTKSPFGAIGTIPPSWLKRKNVPKLNIVKNLADMDAQYADESHWPTLLTPDDFEKNGKPSKPYQPTEVFF